MPFFKEKTSRFLSVVSDNKPFFISLLCAVVSLTVYINMLCPTISVGDTTELITAAAVWGIPHAPGYPLYTFLAHFFSYIPFGEMGWRINLSAAVFSALSIGMIAFLLFRLTENGWAAFGGALMLAFSEGFWFHGLVAEVFSLSHVLAAGLFLIAFLPKKYSPKHLMALALLGGISVGHHHLLVMLSAPLIYYVFRSHPDMRSPVLWLKAFGVFVIGYFVFQLFIPLRAGANPVLNWGHVDSVQSFFHLLSRADFGGVGSAAHSEGSANRTGPMVQLYFLWGTVLRHWTWVGIGFTFWGLWSMRKKPVLLQTVLFGILISGPILLIYAGIPLHARYGKAALERFLLILPLWMAIPIGFGLASLIKSLQFEQNGKVWKFGWVLGFAWVFLFVAHGKAVDQSENTLAKNLGEDLIKGSAPGSIVLLSDDVTLFALNYFDAVEEKLEGRKVIHVSNLSWPWYEKEIRSRFPQVKLKGRERADGKDEKVFLPSDIAQDNIGTWQVYISPKLLEGDAELGKLFYFEPTSLLLRVTDRPDLDIARFATRTDEFLKGDWQKAFRREQSLRPTLETKILWRYLEFLVQLGLIYEANGFDGDSELVFNKAVDLSRRIGDQSLVLSVKKRISQALLQIQQSQNPPETPTEG